MLENADMGAPVPPFKVYLFHQPAISRNKVMLKEVPIDVPVDDLEIQVRGSGARPIVIAPDSSLSFDAVTPTVFSPWDIVQIVALVDDPRKFVSVVRQGEFDVLLREPKHTSSFVRENKKGEKRAKIPSHIYALIKNENKAAYMTSVTFCPDDELVELYIPRPDNVLTVIEIRDNVLRIWTIGLCVSGGVTYQRVSFRDLARPLDFEIGQTEVLLTFVNENSHMFFE